MVIAVSNTLTYMHHDISDISCLHPEVSICGAIISLAIAFASQLFLIGCIDACAASILAILSAIAIQIRLRIIVF